MKARNLSHRLIAVITFLLGLGATLLWSNLSQPDKFQDAASETIGVLKPARGVTNTSDQTNVWTSNNLMAVTRPEHSSIQEPVRQASEITEDLIETNCGTILLSINDAHLVAINDEQVGTLENFGKVAAIIRGFFNERIRMRAFSWSMQSRDDLTDEERIYKTVLIKPAPSLTMAEVRKVLEMVRQTGAEPIALYTHNLENTGYMDN